MTNWWKIYLMVAFTGTFFSLVLTPLFKMLAEKIELFDVPADQMHKGHSEPTPLLGGGAICAALLGTIVFGFCSASFLKSTPLYGDIRTFLPGMRSVSFRTAMIALGAVGATLLGLYDDKFNMSAKAKFGGQFVIAAIAVTWGGARITAFISTPVIAWCVSIFWFLLIINAINFFDNMDGLAVGTATIAFSFFSIAAATRGQHFVAALGAASAGASLGFWFYNHSPASIFMGDSGSHLLGYLLATMGCLVTYYKSGSGESSPFSVLIPLFILGLPLFDALAVTAIRFKLGKPFYIGDHNHISHRFLK
ncbi:MAG: undecaprenyl/decaprenyl-phosphate alpha-N-acetylglucosaminyl 1-phosphate transferase, partial [Kiritimatiellaeota bacterium]|nr:undecaprenyl/decaprenyl-phosphate alpha-N-acetylglucosaminyl 1-phosphate transferase [Kiritimatiellota bacterium]